MCLKFVSTFTLPLYVTRLCLPPFALPVCQTTLSSFAYNKSYIPDILPSTSPTFNANTAKTNCLCGYCSPGMSNCVQLPKEFSQI